MRNSSQIDQQKALNLINLSASAIGSIGLAMKVFLQCQKNAQELGPLTLLLGLAAVSMVMTYKNANLVLNDHRPDAKSSPPSDKQHTALGFGNAFFVPMGLSLVDNAISSVSKVPNGLILLAGTVGYILLETQQSFQRIQSSGAKNMAQKAHWAAAGLITLSALSMALQVAGPPLSMAINAALPSCGR